MKRILLFLLCSSPLLLNAMTEVNVKHNTLKTIEIKLKAALLRESVKNNDITTAKALLAEKIIYNRTSLTYLLVEEVCNLNVNMIKILLDAGADINGIDGSNRNYTLLMIAIENKYPKITKLLVHSGANINYQATVVEDWTKKNKSALILAIELGQTNMVQLLIAHGADLNQINQIDFDKIPNKLAIIRAIELGKKERQTLLEKQKRLEEQKISEAQEEKKSEISLTPYSGIYPQLGDDVYHQLSASESAKSKSKIAKKSQCTIL